VLRALRSDVAPTVLDPAREAVRVVAELVRVLPTP